MYIEIQNSNQLHALPPAQREVIVSGGFIATDMKFMCRRAQTAEEAWERFFAWAEIERRGMSSFGLSRAEAGALMIVRGDAQAWVLAHAYLRRLEEADGVKEDPEDFEYLEEIEEYPEEVEEDFGADEFEEEVQLLPLPDFGKLREEYGVRQAIVGALRPRPSTAVVDKLYLAGCRTGEDARAFLQLEEKIKGDSDPVRVFAVATAKIFKRLPLWVKAQVALNESVDLCRPGRPRDLVAAATMWRMSPVFRPWKREAVRLGRLPLKKRLVAVAVATRLTNEVSPAHWRRNRQVRLNFWQGFNEACRNGGLAAVANDLPDNEATRRRVAFAIHGKALSVEQVKALAFAALPDQLIGLKSSAWKKATEALHSEEWDSYIDWTDLGWYGHSGLYLAVTFGKRWGEWLRKQSALGRSGHDASYWLPQREGPAALKGLEHVLFRNGTRPLPELEIVSKNWADLSQEERKLPWRELLAACRTRRYAGQRHKAFALEAAHWGIPELDYSAFEQIYLDGQSVPEPFDSQQRWEVGGYVSRFLPREDVRTGFFGHYTNCCQHFEGFGAACAVSTVADVFSQLFVIEEDGEILAGSWAWQTQHDGFRSVCFDNVEAKGLSPNQHNVIAQIYEEVAQHLCSEGCRKVTIGTGLSDLDLSRWEATEALPLPEGYGEEDYSDSKNQVLVAENPSAPAIIQGQSMVWVRGGLEEDLDAAEYIAEACYPEGWDHVSVAGATSQSLVLLEEKAGVIGYATFDSATRYVADLAVLPEFQQHSNVLLRALLERCNDGQWWSADCRESTSLRLLRLYARRGVIALEEQGAADSIGSEACTQVIFRVQ